MTNKKVNLDGLTFFFVDQTLRISNLSFIEGLLQIQSFKMGLTDKWEFNYCRQSSTTYNSPL